MVLQILRMFCICQETHTILRDFKSLKEQKELETL